MSPTLISSGFLFKENSALDDKPTMGRILATLIIAMAFLGVVSTSQALEEVLDPAMDAAPVPGPGKCFCPLPHITQNSDPCDACKSSRECAKQTCEYSGLNSRFAKTLADKLIPRPFPMGYAALPPDSLVTQSTCQFGQVRDCSCDSSLFEEPTGDGVGAEIVCLQQSSYQCDNSACVFKKGDEIIPYPPKYKDNVDPAKKKFTTTFGFPSTQWPACGVQR